MIAEITVAVLTLFRPGYIVVAPADQTVVTIKAGSKRIEVMPGRKAGLRMEGREVDVFANREMTSARAVEIGGRTGEGEFTLSIPGKITRRFRGTLRVTADGSMLLPVLTVPMERAVWRAVSAELPGDAPDEAKKAMAVVARSYYAASRRRHREYDFCDTTHCQFFAGAAQELAGTEGLRLYYQDRAFAPVYSASCGGRTRTAAENGWAADEYPYFAVECGACARKAEVWERRLAVEKVRPLLEARTEAARLSVNRLLGWMTVPSNFFELKRDGEFVEMHGRGQGHGAGLCQLGAMEMAREGRGFMDILRAYFPAVAVR